MTTTIRGNVRQDRNTGRWYAHAYSLPFVYVPAVGEVPEWHELESAASWPEAMQAAYKLLADLDAALVNDVYASRATRRQDRIA